MDESRFPVKRFNQGDILFKTGDMGSSAYSLQKGRVEISIENMGKKVMLAVLNPPAVFGEMALLLKEQRRSATATVIVPSDIVEITKSSFMEVLDGTDSVIKSILNSALERLKDTTGKVSKSPDPFLAAAEVLNLFVMHSCEELEYFNILKALCEALRLDTSKVEEVFEKLEQFRLVEMKTNDRGKKVIHVKHKDTFLSDAKKVYEEM
ncbi:MAG: cyclic nucleotide-binding domain-containing protein [Deltaproteobacteria bacterium]|nr:cyclic nucleotide-binding domain-containing protein [Deltaproteobacteria bacterium]